MSKQKSKQKRQRWTSLTMADAPLQPQTPQSASAGTSRFIDISTVSDNALPPPTTYSIPYHVSENFPMSPSFSELGSSSTNQAHPKSGILHNDSSYTSNNDLFPANGTTATPRFSISPSIYSPEYVVQLRTLIHPKEVLQRNGYVISPLTEDQLHRKKKCVHCGKSMGGRIENTNKIPAITSENEGRRGRFASENPFVQSSRPSSRKDEEFKAESSTGNLDNEQLQASEKISNTDEKMKPSSERMIRCRFHNGRVVAKQWTCCGKQFSDDPCQGHEYHIPQVYPDGFLESLWQFHQTPTTKPFFKACVAVAIDCEMGTSESGDSELIRITLIDYFTSSVLIDSLVWPDVAMRHYNTRYSGVTRQDMNNARRRGKCLMGKDEARRAVWQYVNAETIVVAHAGNNDLSVLRWAHEAVVDTLLIDLIKNQEAHRKAEEKRKAEVGKEKAKQNEIIGESVNQGQKSMDEGVMDSNLKKERTEISDTIEKPPKMERIKKPKGTGDLCLKTLAKVRLGRDIQTGGNRGHNSLEDAIAARDLAHWAVVNRVSLKFTEEENQREKERE